jgi:LmbE family N-acetylglucosaminyl deacetylase
VWFDISGTLDKKIKALQSHRSQLGGRTEFPKRMRAWAKSIGATWNMPAAEAFRYIELG